MRRILVLLILTLTGASAMALEEPTYEVLLTVGEVEFRRYEPYMLAEVTVDGDAKDRSAFKILAGYIFGDNDAAEKMNMTAPVETRGSDYAFVMERKYSRESLPQPNDENIRIVERPSRVVAAVRFSGRWTQGNFRKHEQELVEALAAMGVKTTGAPELARYNAPFTPWFLRRNEIVIPVDWKSVNPEALIASDLPARL
jgi:effector-binding domain-containing protein